MIDENTLMPFGKHANNPLRDVPADYLLWFWDQEWKDTYPIVCQYVKENLKHLREEAKAERDSFNDMYWDHWEND